MQIFSTFVTGTGKIIEEAVKNRPLNKIRIISLLDGLVIYETKYTLKDIRRIHFFNNSFVLIQRFEKLGPHPITEMIRESIKSLNLEKEILRELDRQETFKVITSVENQFVAADRALLKKLESKISSATNLRLNIKNPDAEFWFLSRTEKMGFLGLRITYPNQKARKLKKGELRPELAHILCLESEPSPHDIFLDAFAGYGAIPTERAASFPYKEIIAVEKDEKKINSIRAKLRNHKHINILQDDALSLKSIKKSSVDKIVTDPPWGIYEKVAIPLSEFYDKMLATFYRVLKQEGILVVLTGAPAEFEKALNSFPKKFRPLRVSRILVSGKKANICKLQKVN